MSKENKIKLTKRLKSFAWRTGMMVIALGVDFLMVNLELFDMPGQITVILGLVLGEVSKQLNTPK